MWLFNTLNMEIELKTKYCSFLFQKSPIQITGEYTSGGSRVLIEGGIFIYSGSAQLISFEIDLISKEISQVEPKYMNMHPLN